MDHLCLACNVTFASDNKNAKACSRTCCVELCARSKRHRTTTICVECGTSFEAKASLNRKFCNQSCASKHRMRQKSIEHTVQLICVVCQRSFETIKYYADHGRKCCSVKCGNEYANNGTAATVHPSHLDKICESCAKQYTVIWKHRDSKYCSKRCSRDGIVSWNTGLTAETDPRLAHCRDVSRQTQRDRFLNGKTYQPGKGSWHESSKMVGSRQWLRSTYETRFANVLDSDVSVISYEYEPIEVPYLAEDGRERSYYPDFKVERLGKPIEIVEVKPLKLIDKRGNTQKIAAGRVHCTKLGWTFLLVTELDL